MATKKKNSQSWVIATQKVLKKNGLPNILQIIGSDTSKKAWKGTVKKAVHIFWKQKIELEATKKSILKHLNLEWP